VTTHRNHIRPRSHLVKLSRQGAALSFEKSIEDANNQARKAALTLEKRIEDANVQAKKAALAAASTITQLKKKLRPRIYLASTIALVLLWEVGHRSIRIDAWNKFLGAWKMYLTIPLIAGIVNMITNKISVWMIFNPLEYAGKTWLPRPEGQPLGFLGWQGIVPAKARKMGRDITKTLLTLVDVKTVLARLDTKELAQSLVPGLEPVLDKWVRGRVQEQLGSPLMPLRPDSKLYSLNGLYESTLRTKLGECVARVVAQIQADPIRFLDLETSVGEEIYKDKASLVQLFQTCGKSGLA